MSNSLVYLTSDHKLEDLSLARRWLMMDIILMLVLWRCHRADGRLWCDDWPRPAKIFWHRECHTVELWQLEIAAFVPPAPCH
jgi:hypothetical protein